MDSGVTLTGISGLPNIFDVISSEGVTGEFIPFISRLLKLVASKYTPYGDFVKRYVDEIVYCLDLIVETRYLFTHCSSLGEHFYELVRVNINKPLPDGLTRSAKIKSLMILVVVPYIHQKLSKAYSEVIAALTLFQRRAAQSHRSNPSSTSDVMRYYITLFNRVRIFYDAIEFLLKILYLLKIVEVPSVWLYLAGVKLQKSVIPPVSPENAGLFTAVFGRPFSRFLGIVLFGLRLASVWNQQQNDRQQRETVSIFEGQPPTSTPPEKVPRFKNTACPLCNGDLVTPTVLPACGLAFCFKCIYKYVIDNGCCPITKVPASSKDLVKLFL